MDWQLIFGAISAAALVTIAIVSAFGLKSVTGFYSAQSKAQKAEISLLEKQQAPALVEKLTSVSRFANQLQEELDKTKTDSQGQHTSVSPSMTSNVRLGIVMGSFEAMRMSTKYGAEAPKEIAKLVRATTDGEKIHLPFLSEMMSGRQEETGRSAINVDTALDKLLNDSVTQDSETPPE